MSEPPSEIRGGVMTVPLSAISIAVSRSSGPGGQNVNKQNTRVELHVSLSAITGGTPEMHQRLRAMAGKRASNAGELRLVSQQTRSLEQNREIALFQLRTLLEEASKVPRKRRPTKPSKGAKRRRLENKKRRGEIKRSRSSAD